MLPVNITVEKVCPRVISLEWDILKSCSSIIDDNMVVRFRVLYTSDGEFFTL